MSFAITDKKPPRFEGEFTVTPLAPYTPNTAESSYVGALDEVSGRLADEEAEDQQVNEPNLAGLVEAKRARRRDAVALLRTDADMFCSGNLSPAIAQVNTSVIWGRYTAVRDQLLASLFVVHQKTEPTWALAVDVLITVAQNLPPPNDTPSAEKQSLFVELDAAVTTIKTVCQRMRDRANGWFNKKLFDPAKAIVRADRLQDEYIRKLSGIGRLGLEGPHVTLAKLALEGMRQEFVAAEAGRIKNSYVRNLGAVACIVAALFIIFYASVDFDLFKSYFWHLHKPFLLAGAGASVGTWLSFSVRRVKLGFADLAILEEDLLDPSVRVVFVVLLAEAACLLFWTGAMNIEIGLLKTAHFAGATSFLVGIFLGLSERTLATALGGRAASFVKGIGGI